MESVYVWMKSESQDQRWKRIMNGGGKHGRYACKYSMDGAFP